MINKDDIINKRFSRSFRGYDIKEVDMFLDMLIKEFERIDYEREIAAVRIKTLLDEVERLQCSRERFDQSNG